MEEIRETLFGLCRKFIDTRLETASFALQQAREAANDDTKSSAGDKFETTREMMQQEIDRNKRLLLDAQEQEHLLLNIAVFQPADIVKHGTIVTTSQGNFYLSISAGQLHIGKDTYFAVTPSSPIGQLLMGKKAGDSFELNNRKYNIKQIS